MTRRYLVIYEEGPGNLSGFAPDLPGCGSTGHSLEDLRENLREAMEFHLEGLALRGHPLPEPTMIMEDVEEMGYAEWMIVKPRFAQPICAWPPRAPRPLASRSASQTK